MGGSGLEVVIFKDISIFVAEFHAAMSRLILEIRNVDFDRPCFLGERFYYTVM
jgi:hypothetical protein